MIHEDEARQRTTEMSEPKTSGKTTVKKKKRQDTDTLTDNQHKRQDPHQLTLKTTPVRSGVHH